jgi:hypothetical protein
MKENETSNKKKKFRGKIKYKRHLMILAESREKVFELEASFLNMQWSLQEYDERCWWQI